MELSIIFEILGTAGSVIICVSGIPQIIKTYKTKSSGDLSLLYLGALLLGMTMLQAYSIYRMDFIFIFGNTLSMAITCILIFFSFKYRNSAVGKIE
jgi:MtN3 and saliva related transmembrane protein